MFKIFCFIYVSKGVIWGSEYSLGPQLWGSGGPRPLGPPVSTIGNYLINPMVPNKHKILNVHTFQLYNNFSTVRQLLLTKVIICYRVAY